MEAVTLRALEARAATVPGGRDLEERPVMFIPVPHEPHPHAKDNLCAALQYLLSIFSEGTRCGGFTVIVDAQKGQWRVARALIRQVTEIFTAEELGALIVLRPDAFWDKQRVENCTKTHKEGQALYIPRSRLGKYIHVSQLPDELGGRYIYNHTKWLENRIKVEDFLTDAYDAQNDLDQLKQHLLDNRSLRVSEIDRALNTSSDMNDSTRMIVHSVMETGKELLQNIEYENRNRKFDSEFEAMSTPQDTLDSIQKIDNLLDSIQRKKISIDEAWIKMEKSFGDTKDLNVLEEGVARVTNWILGPAEMLLNSQQKVGFDVMSAEELRREHESLELQCWDTYGQYAELIHKIESFPSIDISSQQKDLLSQRDFMDFVCRSFATRLERRRNILITSLRFFRLVSEYFDCTSEVFEQLVMGNKIHDFSTAAQKLRELQENQSNLDSVQRELEKEGEKLSDMLSMPVKDALGRDVAVDYEEDIINIRDILDATIARKNIFSDSVELQKLTLEQVTHINTYEKDVDQAVQWIYDLFNVMVKEHGYVGCNVSEIQTQKDEHQAFQETAKGTYNYGCQLLNASLSLRQSCKLPLDDHCTLSQKLRQCWQRLLAVTQEQMTRLRVSAVFHRSVDEHCVQLTNLRESVESMPKEEAVKKRARVRKFMVNREKLLVEVGRMVRLGRLLRTRLREPLFSDEPMSGLDERSEEQNINEGNATAVEAISERLSEVTGLAEQLDMALRGAQEDCAINSSLATVTPSIKKIFDGTASTSEEWSTNPKLAKNGDDGDDEFVTASECTYTQSRSSSFNTVSDCGHYSPWWEFDKNGEINEDISREKMVLAVGCPDLPPPKSVLKPSIEVPPGKIAHEVTETTHIKVQHCHTLGVSSFVLTSETVRDGKADGQARREDIKEMVTTDMREVVIPVSVDDEENIDEFMRELKETGDWIQLKILEVEPELTKLGATLAEALELQRAHDEVLLQLQNKQSPVEELLRQADQLISTQRPRAEVYAAMAESLGRAWKDVNQHLELRKQILDLNVLYHKRADDFRQKTDALEQACNDSMVPIEIEAVKTFLTNIHDLRRSLLESLMTALQAGNQLLAKIKELAADGTLDSRPERIRASVNRAIAQVEKWLDELHVKRQLLEISWQSRKTQLEQCLALAMLARDLRELEDIVSERREMLANSDHLGDSSSSAELFLHEHQKLVPESRQLQERAIKITKATEQLVSSGCFAGEQATAQAYTVLAATSDYLADLDSREVLLSRAITFFKNANEALSQLDQLEVQLTTADLPITSPKLAQLHGQCASAIEEITSAPLQEGHGLLADAGRGKTGTDGVKMMVEELENRKIFLDGMCTAHKEENLRIAQALNTFLEKQNELYSWLVSIAEAFLQQHQDMGSDLATAKDFMNLHNQLLNDLQTKGNEINSLLLTLPPILEYLDDPQRHDVDSKVEVLHEHWLKLKNILETRLDLAAVYVRFHTEANTVSREMDDLEDSLKNCPPDMQDDILEKLEDRWSSLVPLYQQAKNTGLNFISQSSQVSDAAQLSTGRACACVESVLERLSGRQLTVSRSWQSYRTDLQERRELLVLWERTMTESTKTIDWASKLDAQLYPIITTHSTSPRDIHIDLENKLKVILTEIRGAQSEVEQRIKTADNLIQKTRNVDEGAINIKNKLNELSQKLVNIITDYQVLIEMLISYFKNLSELDRTVENVNNQYINATLPSDIYEVETMIREHGASKQAILEMFKFTKNECEQIIERIRKQEPPNAAEHDIDKMVYILNAGKDRWESSWNRHNETLDQHRQLSQFNFDLHQINETLDDLSRQLTGVKGQYGESISSAKATSLAFAYFEKTIELLQQRIEVFVNSGEKLLAERHGQSPRIERELTLLKNRWIDFQQQVKDTRRLIDLGIEYFRLVDEADEWFRDGSKLLVTIARKSTSVKTPEEATGLLNEIAVFLKPGEETQNGRIKKISEYAIELFGIEHPKQVTQVMVENREMLDSFTVIRNELHTLTLNLKAAEEQREKLKREQELAAANLAAAKAEAEAAEIAAKAAEEARKAAEEARKTAETAAQLLREATEFTEKVEKIHIIEVETEPITATIERSQPEIVEIIEESPQPQVPQFVVPLTDAVIQEGSRFTFRCQVDGFPMPVVTWHKDGMSIQNNPDYQTTFDQGVCTLSIEETFAEDTARYTCRAINAAGNAETAAVLSVKETEPNEQLMPPTFSKILEPGIAKEGSSYQFDCKVEGNPLPTVQWFKNYECIDNSPDFAITYNNGEAILKFEEVFLEDKAEYTCKANNELGTSQCTASLSIEPLEPTTAPEFIVPVSNIMARAGQKIKLECEVAGLPPPEVNWMHNGKLVKESRDLKLQCDNNKATLVISEAFPKDAGTYVVTATNIAGEATSSCNVSVKGRLPTETSDSELASDMEPIKPSIQLPLKDVSIFEGKRVRLDCVIVGQPEPEVIWYHDDRPVKESSDFQLLFQGDRCSLIIQEAFGEDAGEYKVIAINSAGEASSKCNLKITPVGDSEPATRAQEDKVVSSGSPPRFSKLLSDVLVSEGDRIILECCVTGDPVPDIRWLLNNQEIHASEHVLLTHSSDGNVKLEIAKVTPDDKGVFTVKASNCCGDAKCFAQLIVKSIRTNEAAGIIYEEGKVAPAFKELFADRTCFENQTTKFECIVIGKPSPKVRWLFNGEPVSGKDYLVSTSGERQVLSIPEVTLSNQGKITCVAENEVSKASCEAYLSVQPIALVTLPDMQNSVHVDQHSESSYSMKREVFVQSSSSSKIISSSSTGAEPQVQVHSVTSQDQQSFKQVNQQAPEIVESHKIEKFHQINKEPPVISEKSYSAISSGQDVKVQEGTKIVIHKPTRKATPPRFVTPVVGKIVDQGVDVVLEGILDGHPTPNVSWMKNGAPLLPSDTVQITWELNHAKLVLKRVTVRDAGKYTCTAVNEAGSAVSTTDLVVKKTIFPPVFGRRLQAQVVKKGDRLIMEVEVTGTPEPTITWHKDDSPVESSLKGGYRSKTQGNCHTLIIDKVSMEHTGKYMVRAINSGGEAQSIADIAIFEPTPDTMMEVVKTVVFEDVEKQEIMTSADQHKTSTPVPTFKPVTVDIPVTILPDIYKDQSLVTQSTQSFMTSSEFSNVTQSRVLETKKFVLEHSTPSLPTPKPIQPRPHEHVTHEIPVLVEKEQKLDIDSSSKSNISEVVTQIDQPLFNESGIETTSITKQSSLGFFVSKMKESEEPSPPKMTEVQKIPSDIYTKFEDVSAFKKQDTHKYESQEIKTEIKKEEYVPPPFSTKEYQQVSSSQTQIFEEFNLTPEPPPEMGFIPKSEISYKKDVTEKIKRLEDSHRDLSPMEVPMGAVKIFPTAKPNQIEETKSNATKEKIVRRDSYHHTEASKPAIETKYLAPITFKSEAVHSHEESSVFRPQANVITRPLSPRPSAEGVEMEKLWTTHRPLTPEIRETIRASSPKPSAQGITMEKLWTPHKTEEIEQTSSFSSSAYTSYDKTCQRSISGAIEPSLQAKTMEKMWAHKHADSQLQTVWPPSQEEIPEPKTIQKTVQTTCEKQWTPVERIQQSEQATLEKHWAPIENVQKSLHSTAEKQWAPIENIHKSVNTTIEKQWAPIENVQKSIQTTIQRQWAPVETHFESKYVNKSMSSEILQPQVPIHYVSDTRVTHISNIMDTSFSKSEHTETTKSTTRKENIVEESQRKPSEIIKSWPPVPIHRDDHELKAPQMVRETVPKIDFLPIRPVSVQDITDEVYLEPGPPPEIGFAQAPKERRQSYVEIIEQDLEKNLQREPSRVLPGSVRTMPPPREKSLPPPLPPKKEQYPQAPPLPAKPIKIEHPKAEIEFKPFERFPDLEPFPFKPDSEKGRIVKPPPPPTPSKFIKGRFGDSDYESDFESMRIPTKWKPCASDNEEPAYRKVKPPRLTPVTRSRSTEPEPLPPSKFDQPPIIQGPPRPRVDLETTKQELKKEFSSQKLFKQTKKETRTHQVNKVSTPPDLKPGSPPVFVQAEPPKPKPESPKAKPKLWQESGYMADTDEPFMQVQRSMRTEHQESLRTEVKHFSQSSESIQKSQSMFETHSSSQPHVPSKVYHKHEHKKQVSSTASKKELVAPSVSVTNQRTVHKEESRFEPFPFKPDQPKTKQVRVPPPPSPSKFVKGEFRESDYESDYEGRIPPVWRPLEADNDLAYKPVRPVLSSSGRHSRSSTGIRTPTPPTEFDNPPHIEYPPRPKFEPIEKPKQSIKLDEIFKSTSKPQVVFKPKAMAARPAQMMEMIVATPARQEPVILQPGSPPEIGFAPTPTRTQYYHSVSGTPFHNATQTETSNIMHFNESTEKSHRVVSVQQTTRVIKFGESQKKETREPILEPFPYKPDPERPRRSSAPPPPKPKKFVPGELRESDYESEIESARIKPKWKPGYNGTDDLQYRKVCPPSPSSIGRPSSVPAHSRIITPLEFDTQPPVITNTITRDVYDGQSIKRITDIRNRFEDARSSQQMKHLQQSYKSNEVDIQPGTPPEYGYSAGKSTVTKATRMASQHMEDMTHAFKSKAQKFVNDIMTDVKTPQKPILKAPEGSDDAQAYREESRVAQYGTKHIDPDTGLIYFKYDFGYEFGVILPGEGKSGEIPQPKKTIIQPPKRAFDIEMPVHHETSKQSQDSSKATNKASQFRPKNITLAKNVKWEPTSESEMSEIEGDFNYKKRHNLLQPSCNARWDQASASPASLSPSLPSMSPAFNNVLIAGSGNPFSTPGKNQKATRGNETPPSTPSTPGSSQAVHQNSTLPKKAPMIITPLRDIAVVSGQTARFECIVQSEPSPSILWSKNGRIIENSSDYQIQFRNGVCRLSIPQAFPEDAGTYTCTATNQVGVVNTTATLQVPGERRSSYIK